MTSREIAIRIEERLKELNKKKTWFYETCDISRATFSLWKNGKAFPSKESLEKVNSVLDLHFSTTEAYESRPLFSSVLRNPKVDEANRIVAEMAMKDIEKPAPSEGDGQDEIIQIFSELEPSRRSKLLELARLYLDDQRRSAKSE